jgi:hypothetical protein
MKKTFAAAVAIFSCVSASAQITNFEGFSGSLNLNTTSTNSKLSADGQSAFDSIGQQSWNGSVQVAYGFAASQSAVVSVGGTYALGDSKGGEIGVNSSTSSTIRIRAKSVFSLYVEPGFLLNDKTLAYGKLSYEDAKGTGSLPGEGKRSRSMSGIGFGAGFRTMLNKTSFIQLEIKQVNYKRIDLLVIEGASFKPKATLGTIGFGINF